MGTTAASLHIALPYGAQPDQSGPLLKAYAKLGWARPKRGQTGTRSVILARGRAPFVSVHDSACEALDDGTLRQLAAHLSKALRTAAIVTTVLDSDEFTFLLYNRGKQVDAITDSSNGLETGLKSVRGKRQLMAWRDAFFVVRPGNAVPEDFVERAKAAETLETPFSEQRLEAWCALAGLPPEAATAASDDLEQDGAVVARLELVHDPKAAPPAPGPETGAPKRELAFLMSPDDHPQHGFYPAAWPMPPLARQTFGWAVVCRDGGIERLKVSLALDRAGAFAVHSLTVRAFSFHNGQIMSETPLATASQEFAAAADASSFVLDAPAFALRAPAPGSRAQAILLLDARIQSLDAGDVTVRPAITADDDAALALPPLRLAVVRPAWRPLVMGEAPPDLKRIMPWLRLNATSLRTEIAILPGEDAAALGQARRLLEGWLPLLTAADALVTVATQKHLSASFRIPKSETTLPLRDLTVARIWAKLFDPESGYQTVRLSVSPPGAPWPYAGFSVQTPVRGGRLRPDRELRDAGSTAVAFWTINDPGAAGALGLDWPQAAGAFHGFMQTASVLQGWEAECAWQPEFDTYEDYHQTIYERAASVDWFRSGEQGRQTGQAWLGRRLRFVSPLIWLGDALASAVDPAALAEVATVTRVAAGLEIKARPGVGLRALEEVLRPVLGLQDDLFKSAR